MCSYSNNFFSLPSHSSQFKHTRMKEPGSNVEITNPIYMREYDEDEGGPDYGDFHSDKVKYSKTMVLLFKDLKPWLYSV